MPLSGDDASGSSVATTDGSPEEPSAQIALTRDSAVGGVERLGQARHGFGRERRVEAANRERQVLPHPRVVVFRRLERFHERGRQRAVGPDLRIAHQPRQFVGRGPAPIRPAIADFAQVFLRRPIVGQQRAEPDVRRHGETDDGQRNQKKLNSEGGRGD